MYRDVDGDVDGDGDGLGMIGLVVIFDTSVL
jgi:hypothetical protein